MFSLRFRGKEMKNDVIDGKYLNDINYGRSNLR